MTPGSNGTSRASHPASIVPRYVSRRTGSLAIVAAPSVRPARRVAVAAFVARNGGTNARMCASASLSLSLSLSHRCAVNGDVCGGGNPRSRHQLGSGHDRKRIKVGTIVEICVVFGSDGTADVSVTLDGNLRGVMARGLRGPQCPAVFLRGEAQALTLLRYL
jgi:hypothetical protein